MRFFAWLALPLLILSAARGDPPPAPDHWADEAIARLMREGILVGYPDTTLKGGRVTTRFEFAVAIHAAIRRIQSQAEEIARLREALRAGDPMDLSALDSRLSALEAAIRLTSEQRSTLHRLAAGFSRELEALGVSVEELRQGLADADWALADRPTARISGESLWFALGGEGDGGGFAISPDGRLLGWDADRGRRASWLGDANVLHQLAVNVEVRPRVGPWIDARLSTGNLQGRASGSTVGGIGTAGSTFGGTFVDEGASDFAMERVHLTMSAERDALPFDLELGRIGAQALVPFVWRRPDTTPLLRDPFLDSGDSALDGARLVFGTPSGRVRLYGGTQGAVSTRGRPLSPLAASGFGVGGQLGPDAETSLVTGTLGIDGQFDLSDFGTVSMAYVTHLLNPEGEAALDGAERVATYGGEISFRAGPARLRGGYARSEAIDGRTLVGPPERSAIFASAEVGEFSIKFRRIDAAYLGAGEWARLGGAFSPRGIRDWTFSGRARVLGVQLSGLFTSGELLAGGLDYEAFRLDAMQPLGGGVSARAGWEGFVGSLPSGTARQSWLSVGLERSFARGHMGLTYQYANVRNQGQAWGTGPSGRYRGHIVGAELRIRF